jgi:tRNA nucleotidyltransferase (CCA-adding enzyme)
MSDELDAVIERVRERVEPDGDERAALDGVVEELTARAEDAVEDLPVEGEVVLAGSTARETWLAGERDIDLFVRLPPDLDREKLREYGLAVGHAVVDGREEYAEHPYVVGELDGFQVDIVPCYALADATDIQSAVDRTPFHTRYVRNRLDRERASDVRIAKQFLTGIGVYGSDLRTRGFSGYLTELLVLEYGGFRGFVEAAADWQPPVRLDPREHGTGTFDDALVVIDPTDPGRNVAAVLSTANLARVQHFARELLANPRVALFEPPDIDPLDAESVRAAFEARGTTPVALRLTVPNVVDDQLWPQLRRSVSGIAGELDRRGFDVFRTDAFAQPHESDIGAGKSADPSGETDEDATDGADTASGRTVVLLFELAVAERPRVERHEGPPVAVREHAESFYEAYADGDAYGPFVQEDRYVVERERSFTSARAFLDSDALLDVALGAAIERALADEYDLLYGRQVGSLAGAFGTDFTRYLDPTVDR